MMKSGLRVLAVGKSENRRDELIFLGLIGISDPPKASAGKAVCELRDRGVEVKMITGDAKETAIAIASVLGIDNGISMSGKELEEIEDYKLPDLANRCSIFYRTSPQHKLKIVKVKFSTI
jgi:Ca2+-transporting ATPase